MRLKWDQWIFGLAKGVIGGGAGSVTAGLGSMALSPQTFNITTWGGAGKVLSLMFVCFAINGFISMMMYLSKSPLPDPVTGNTDIISKKDI